MARGDPRDPLDPRGLIAEAYEIEGIGAPECRSIFLDWAMGYAGDGARGVADLLARHAGQPADHPMTQTLRAGLAAPATPQRRGGRSGRVRG